MFDIGPGEFAVLVVVGILVIGPERLPSMLRQGSAMMRSLRGQIANAKQELNDTVGPQVGQIVDMVGELNPRRLLSDVAGDVTAASTGFSAPAGRAGGSGPANAAPVVPVQAAMPDAPIIDADTP